MTFHELGLPSDVLLWKAGILTMASFAIGVLGGLVGFALGPMRLPILLFMGVSAPIAASTNIIVSSASSIIGATRHYHEGQLNLRLVIGMGIPSLIGAFLGGFYSYLVVETFLIFAVGVLILWQGIGLIVRANSQKESTVSNTIFSENIDSGQSTYQNIQHMSMVSVLGLIIGTLGGAVGLILGSLRLPALIRILGVDPRVSVGTNMAIGALLGASGWVGHVARGYVDYPLIFLLAISAMAGVALGSRYTSRISLYKLITFMGLVMVSMGILLMGRAVS